MSASYTVRVLTPLIVCIAGAAMACQIPVFRYALENWEPDPYVLVVAHRGELSPTDKGLVSELRDTLREHGASLNIELQVVDLSETKEPLLETVLGKEAELIQSPRMVLVYPFGQSAPQIGDRPPGFPGGTPAFNDDSTPGFTPVLPGQPGLPGVTGGQPEIASDPPKLAWSGDLTSTHIRILVQSQVRKQIAKEILDGQSAVWVLLECGDQAKDDAAEATLKQELAQMQKMLKLPDKEAIESDEEYQADTKVNLRIEFSVVRIPHERGDETIFASMLLRSEPDLAASNEPIVIPIFGRGRSYLALVGKNINAKDIEDTCRFLVGDCSCQVKRANPGSDLLFAVAWQDSIKGSALPRNQLPPLTGVGHLENVATNPKGSAETTDPKEPSPPPAAIETQQAATPTSATLDVPTPPTTGADSPATLASAMLTWVFGIAAIGLIVVVAGTVWFWPRA